MKRTFTFNQFLTIINKKNNLKDLRDDSAIQAWDILNKLRDKFRSVNDQFNNIITQTNEIGQQIQKVRKEAEKKAEQVDSDKEKQRILSGARERVNKEFEPKTEDLEKELNQLKEKTFEVEFEPLTKQILKDYGCLTLENLEAFKMILADPQPEDAPEQPAPKTATKKEK